MSTNSLPSQLFIHSLYIHKNRSESAIFVVRPTLDYRVTTSTLFFHIYIVSKVILDYSVTNSMLFFHMHIVSNAILDYRVTTSTLFIHMHIVSNACMGTISLTS